MNQPYHYIGLDIHKRTVAYCEKRADGKLVASGTFSTAHPSVLEWAKERSMPWVGGMEATLFAGHLYDVLKPFAMDLQVGHPLRIQAISSAKHKNDRKDAKTLADLLRCDLFPQCHMASPLVRELRRILRYRNFLVRQAVRMKNKTTGLLMEVGAVYDARRIHQHGYFEEFLGTLDEVPHSVVELLKTSRVGLEMFQEAQKKLVKALLEHEHLGERVSRLMSIDGVGEITALTWALELDEPSRFSNMKQTVSYCGLCSGQNESAGKSKSGPLSKQRNPHLQTVLIEAAKLAPRWNAQLARVHAAELERSGNRNRATCAVARKLATYLMAVDKSRRPYEERTPAR
jgi:transposase